MANKTTFQYRINGYATPTGLDTTLFFDTSHSESEVSPIIKFFEKHQVLNTLILDPRNTLQFLEQKKASRKISNILFEDFKNHIQNTNNLSHVQTNLVFLGYISAVESYFREISRRLILIDEVSIKSCEDKSIPLAAIINSDIKMLPEALFENITFLNEKAIKSCFNEFLGINGVQHPQSLTEAIAEYEKICQLRHCIVHRFGKLGSTNAIKLKLEHHKDFIEKPIKINYTQIQILALATSNLVKEVNQFLWQVVMMRQIGDVQSQVYWKPKSISKWTWDFRKDKKKFKIYYDIFTSNDMPIDLADAYNSFRQKNIELNNG